MRHIRHLDGVGYRETLAERVGVIVVVLVLEQRQQHSSCDVLGTCTRHTLRHPLFVDQSNVSIYCVFFDFDFVLRITIIGTVLSFVG